MSSSIGFLISLVAAGIFGYSAYYMTFDPEYLKGSARVIPPPMHILGSWKFLTYQCLLIQLVNAILHIGAFFVSALQKPRDLWFTCLAYPIGSLVVYTFWAVWHLLGREFIFPKELSDFYHDWLNHATHTIIVPINILLVIFVGHKYSRYGGSILLIYWAAYVGLLHYVKREAGAFPYGYLNNMNDMERIIYFCSTAIFTFLLYKSGQLLVNLIHSKPQPMPAIKKTKQNQRCYLIMETSLCFLIL